MGFSLTNHPFQWDFPFKPSILIELSIINHPFGGTPKNPINPSSYHQLHRKAVVFGVPKGAQVLNLLGIWNFEYLGVLPKIGIPQNG